jgi:hypothetical protein
LTFAKINRWIALIGLASYLFLLLHPVIGHWEKFNRQISKYSQSEYSISQAFKREKVQSECSICQHLGRNPSTENGLHLVYLPIHSDEQSIPFQTGLTFYLSPANIAARAPPTV